MFDLSEYRLIKKAKAGDKHAFEEIVVKYEKFIYNTIYFKIGNSDDAYDLTQEVFIKVFKNLENFKCESKLSAWLYKICINTCRDHVRKTKNQNHLSVSEYEDSEYLGQYELKDSYNNDSDPQYSLERKESIMMVREAIKNLDEEHRDIVIMRDMLGMSYEDISEKMGIELGTVKSRLFRARQKIKEYLLKRNCL